MHKHHIKNRHGLNIVLEYIEAPNAKGLAFVQHGLGGYKEQKHIVAMVEVFNKNGISTVNFDVTHAFGDSDGDLINATLTTYCHDLEDVITWAKTQDWFQSPFFLAGHSLGGGSTLHYTFQNSEEVRAIAPTSAVVSGQLHKDNKPVEVLREWKERGYKEKVSSSKPGAVGNVSYNLFEDMMQYDFTVGLDQMTMPALFLVGTEDDSTPPEHQKILYNGWAGPKMYHEIEDCKHTFKTEAQLAELKAIF